VYARISRFEGGSADVVRAEIDKVRRDVESLKSGTATGEAGRLGGLVDRFVMLADDGSGHSAVIAYCETQEQVREVDRIMDSMSPATDQGHRVSVDVYEVVLDESLRSATSKAA